MLHDLAVALLMLAVVLGVIQHMVAMRERNSRKRTTRRRRKASAPVRQARKVARAVKRATR